VAGINENPLTAPKKRSVRELARVDGDAGVCALNLFGFCGDQTVLAVPTVRDVGARGHWDVAVRVGSDGVVVFMSVSSLSGVV
jgi:hypothetical protein